MMATYFLKQLLLLCSSDAFSAGRCERTVAQIVAAQERIIGACLRREVKFHDDYLQIGMDRIYYCMAFIASEVTPLTITNSLEATGL